MTDHKPIMLTLQNAVTFTSNGETDEAFEVEICCHSSQAYRKALYFRSVFGAAFLAMAEKHANKAGIASEEEGEESNDETLPTIDEQTVRLVLMNPDIDMEEMLVRFDELAKSGVIKVEGKKINPKQLGMMSPEDVETALVKYVSNFITPLVMKALNSTQ